MTAIRLPVLVAALMLAVAPGAQAQGFFERLFGLAPMRQAPPPVTYQNVPAPPGDGFPGNVEEPRRAAPPAPARPVSMRVPTEDGILGRELKLNGVSGSMRVERSGASDLRARLTLVGRRSATSTEACSVQLGGPQGVSLVSQGRPDGLPRYGLQEGGCSLNLDVVDEGVLVKAAGEACVVQSSGCLIEASGMWGPEPGQLAAKARDYEAARAAADKGVRDNYKVMAQRARPENVRPIVAEQAAFSSDREVLCRTYAREGTHSFCNARFSEARLITLAQKLGIAVASNQPVPGAEGRGRRRADPYALPVTNEIIRTPDDD